jgi:glycosyltransferase involved in cell wall biosynthesis
MFSSVIIGTVELFTRQGTGIRTFSRSVVAALASKKALPLDLLVSTMSKTDSSLLTRSNILQKHEKLNRIERVKPFLRAKTKYLLKVPMWLASQRLQRVSAEHPLHAALLTKCLDDAARDYSRPNDIELHVQSRGERGFLCGINLFSDAPACFKINRRFTQVRLPRPSESRTNTIPLYHSPLPFPLTIQGCVNVSTVHDLIPITHPELCLDDPAYFYDLVNELLASFHGIHCISQYTADQIKRYYGSKGNSKIFVAHQPIPLGHLTSDYEMAAQRRLQARHEQGSKGERYILQVGSIEPKKNHSTTLEAFRMLREKDSSLRLVIIGKPGWLTEDVCDYLASAKADNIEWLRAASFSTLIRYMKGASALVFPSIVEGWGLPPLEAMSYGVPVVASPIPPCQEACGAAALYMGAPVDSISMSQRLREILDNPERAHELINAGFEQAKRYSSDQFAIDLLNGYNKAAL